MSMWHCYDRCSGERFEVHGGDEDAIRQGVEAYIREGIDTDTGSVDYDVEATAVDGSSYHFAGTVEPVATDHGPDYVCGDCGYTGDE